MLLSAYFSATETAYSTMSRVRIKNNSEGGSKRAALVLKFYDDYDTVLSTILVGNNVVSLSAATVSAVLFISILGDIGAMVSTVSITVFVLVFCDITPKSMAKESPEKFAMRTAPILYFFIVILTPVNFIFSKWKILLSAVFKTSYDDRSITEEELLSIVEEAEHTGAIDEEDKQLIHSAIEFNDLQAQDIITPRMNIVAIPNDIDTDEIAGVFTRSGYSRIPVYDETVDNIVGIVHIRDFLDLITKKDGNISDIITPATYIAPSVKIKDLFKKLQKEKIHMVVVTDEYGGTEGIVTMEDILEELVGDIWDESDEIIEEFVPIGENKFKIICASDIKKFFEYFELTEIETDSLTVSGWIMDTLGKIPEEGDSFDYGKLNIKVMKIGQRKVIECIVSVIEP